MSVLETLGLTVGLSSQTLDVAVISCHQTQLSVAVMLILTRDVLYNQVIHNNSRELCLVHYLLHSYSPMSAQTQH